MIKPDSEKTKDLKDIIHYLHLWYESYIKTIKFLGTIAVSILVFSSSFFLKDVLSGSFSSKLQIDDISYIKYSFMLLGISLFFVFLNLVVTYQWFITGVDNTMKQYDIDFSSILGDNFEYRRHMGSMGFWGNISLISGWIAGVVLFLGIIFYVCGFWNIIEIIFKK